MSKILTGLNPNSHPKKNLISQVKHKSIFIAKHSRILFISNAPQNGPDYAKPNNFNFFVTAGFIGI